MAAVESFAPIATLAARVLILGSMPGVRSLEAQQYYAHPQNAFWPIMAAALGFDPKFSYRERTRRLQRSGVALWDVLQRCDRRGSLDSAIVADSMRVNEFGAFFARHRMIEAVLCNGGTAFATFARHVGPTLASRGDSPRVVKMPSTSAANAAVSRDRKLAAWRRELRRALGPAV